MREGSTVVGVIRQGLLLAAGLYLLSYGAARLTVFHAVERYRGADGKSGTRQDVIAVRDRNPGEGWPYRLFLPLIRVEEGIPWRSREGHTGG